MRGLSCPEACGVLPDLGLNPGPVRWQAVPNRLDPRGRLPVVKSEWEVCVSASCCSSFFSGICSFLLLDVWGGASSVQTPERVELSMDDHLGGTDGRGEVACFSAVVCVPLGEEDLGLSRLYQPDCLQQGGGRRLHGACVVPKLQGIRCSNRRAEGGPGYG